MDETLEGNDRGRDWQRLPEHVLFAKTHAASLGPRVFCCGHVIVCHIWQCLPQRSKSHCVLVSSGNAQPSPRGMATDVLTTIRNCQAGSSGRAVLPLSAGSVSPRGRGEGPSSAALIMSYRGSPTHVGVWTFCRAVCCV